MIWRRWLIEGEIESLTPFAVRSGEMERIVLDNDSSPGRATRRLVMRDHQKRPYLPATSLKGALRAESGQANALFGAIKDEASGSAALLTVFDAMMTRPGQAGELGAADEWGVYVCGRAAIDDKT